MNYHTIPISGYNGTMKFESCTRTSGISIFCITNQTKDTLCLIPLTYGFLKEAYRITKLPTYQKIIIIMPCIDDTMCSDLYNLIRLLIPKKGIKNIVWCNPDGREWSSDYMYETQCKETELLLTKYGFFTQLRPFLKFKKSIISIDSDYNIYDIIFWDGKTNRLFMNIIALETIIEYLSSNKNYEIHIPFEPSWFGMSGEDLIAIINGYYKKLSNETKSQLKTTHFELTRYSHRKLFPFTHSELEFLLGDEKLKLIEKIKNKKDNLYFHSFASNELCDEFIRKFNIKIGRCIYHDLIR